MSLFLDGKQYFEKKYTNESNFEQTIYQNYRMLFGNNTLYINSKQKIKTNTHKGTIPDGYLFDFELEDFYLVEVELAKHDAYDHTSESNFETSIDASNSEYTVEYHLQNSNNFIKDIYNSLEEKLKNYPEIVFNVQKYYIALKRKRNFAYLKPKKNSLKIVLKLPYKQILSKVKHYQVKECTPPVKNFYGADCCWIKVDNANYVGEVLKVLEEAYLSN